MESQLSTTLSNTLKNVSVYSTELEFRLGRTMNGRFNAYLTKQEFAKIHKWCVDTFPKHGTIATVERFVKTDSNDETCRFIVDKNVYETKRRLAVVTTDDDIAIRMSVSEEQSFQGAPPAKWMLQRTKNRTTFDCTPWKIDLTTVEIIPSHDKDQEFSYEVELELADRSWFFSREVEFIVSSATKVMRDMISQLKT
jgi:hypothetical protein